MNTRAQVKFRNGEDVLTLWVEKEIAMDDGTLYLIGWCPELKNNMFVAEPNVVHEDDAA